MARERGEKRRAGPMGGPAQKKRVVDVGESVALRANFSDYLGELRRLTISLKTNRNAPARKRVSVLFQSVGAHIAEHHREGVDARADVFGGPRGLRASDIAYLLYNLGHLAPFSDANIEGRSITFLLIRLCKQPVLLAKDIGVGFVGISLLAKANGRIDGNVNVRAVHALLKRLRECRDVDAQAIGNSVYALGLLARAGRLAEHVDADVLRALLARLLECQDVDAQAIGSSVYALGLLAQAGQLAGHVDADVLHALLARLLECQDASVQAIGNSVYALGLLARADQLADHVDAGVLNALLARLRESQDVDAQAIGNSVYAIGLLARADQLAGHVDADVLHALLARLRDCQNASAQEISNTFYALGLLVRADQLSGPVDVLPVQRLVDFIHQKREVLVAVDAVQILFGLAALMPAVQCPPVQLRHLFQRAMTKSYLHPREVVDLINYFATFRAYHIELEDEFRALLPSMTMSLEQFSPRSREQLLRNIDELNDGGVGDWGVALQERLGLRQASAPTERSVRGASQVSGALAQRTTSTQPASGQAMRLSLMSRTDRTRPSSSRSAIQNDTLFRLIESKNIRGLAALLGVQVQQAVSRGKAAGSSGGSGIRRFPTVRLVREEADVQIDSKSTANALVERFLKQTEAVALRQLIRESSANYFVLLLRACSNHNRYQLSIANALHPIVLYIPKDELASLVTGFCDLEIYRDHNALLSLVDALIIRMLENPDERELIEGLQSRLIERALAFHGLTHHIHVVQKLEAARARITTTFLHVDEEEPVQLPCMPDVSVSTRVQTTHPALVPVVSRVLAKAGAGTSSFFAPPVVLASRGFKANMRYEYSAEDVEAIFTARMSSLSGRDVRVLAAANMSTGARGNRVADVLSNYIDHYGCSAAQLVNERNLIIPILVNHHWVGIRLSLKRRESPLITYYNSKQNQETDMPLKVDVLLEVDRVLGSKAPWLRRPTMCDCKTSVQQNDSVSCGAYLIENVYCDMKGAEWKEKGTALTKMMRERHLAILQKKRSDFYPGFCERQSTGDAVMAKRSGTPSFK